MVITNMDEILTDVNDVNAKEISHNNVGDEKNIPTLAYWNIRGVNINLFHYKILLTILLPLALTFYNPSSFIPNSYPISISLSFLNKLFL